MTPLAGPKVLVHVTAVVVTVAADLSDEPSTPHKQRHKTQTLIIILLIEFILSIYYVIENFCVMTILKFIQFRYENEC